MSSFYSQIPAPSIPALPFLPSCPPSSSPPQAPHADSRGQSSALSPCQVLVWRKGPTQMIINR